MKQTFLKVLFLLFFVKGSLGQQQGYRPIYDNLVPVAPTAFQFLKYTEMPVSEYTGMPNIGVPIYTIAHDNVQIPIGLSYHAGGIRVNQDASWVGLGWDMTFGSVIQIVNDRDDIDNDGAGAPNQFYPKLLPDFQTSSVPNSYPLRFDYSLWCAGGATTPGSGWSATTPIYPATADYGYKIATDAYFPVNGNFNVQRPEFVTYPEYDSEPDIFKVNFLGHSFNFIRKFENYNNQYIILNKKGYKIDRVTSAPTSGWKVIVPSGEIYYFEEKVVTNSFSNSSDFLGSGSSGGMPTSPAATKTWLLTKIITQNKSTIQFNYTRNGVQGQFVMFSQKYDKMNGASTIGPFQNPTTIAVGTINPANGCINCYGNSFTYLSEENVVLSSIVFPNGQVNFITSDRTDLAGGRKLDRIEVKSTQLVRSAEFNYTYTDASAITSPGFTATDNNYNKLRLKLNWVLFNDGAKYSFEYNSTPLPKKNSFAVDYWGYYNGYLTNTTMVPNPVQFNRPDIGYSNSDNHSSRVEFAKAGILEKVYYPTGGNTVFEYELHEFDNYWVPDYNTSSNVISKGHGLRIKSVRFNSDNSSFAKKTTYQYEGGKAIQPRNMIRRFTHMTANNFSNCYNTAMMVNHYSETYEISSNGFFSSSPLGSINGVGYNKVIKKEVDENGQDLGRIETVFSNNPDKTANSSVQLAHLSTMLPNAKAWNDANGSAKEIYYYSKAGSLQKKIINTYNTEFSEIYYGVRVYFYGYLIHPMCSPSECGQIGFCTCGYSFRLQHLFGFYPIYDSETVLSSSTITDYDNGQSRVTLKGIVYDQYKQVISEYKVFPDQSEEITTYTRTYSATGIVRDYMMGANRLSDIWGIETSVYPPNTYPSIKKAKTNITYKIVGDKFLQDSVGIYDRIQNSGDVPKTITYDLYDITTGNLKEYTTNNLKTSLIWDYNNQYAIAEVKNAAAAEIAYTSFEADGNGGWGFGYNMITSIQGGITGVKAYNLQGGVWKNDLQTTKTYRVSFWIKGDKPGTNTIDANGNPSPPLSADVFQLKATRDGWKLYEGVISNATGIGIWPGSAATSYIDELRIYPDKALMTTFTHIPLVGMSSQNDANNRISYYEYDQANRLSIVRDQDKNIVRKICYNYAGQPEECATFYNSVKTGTFTKTDCGTNGQGTQVTYTVPANRYSGSTQLQADALAQNDVDANGQAYANQFGGCIFSSYDYSNYYYSETCSQFGQTPEPIYVSVPAGMFTSSISLEDANNQAYQYAQNYANQYGTCVSGVDLFLYNNSYGYTTIILTNTSTYEQYYFYVSPYEYEPFGNVPAGNYNVYMEGNYGQYSYQAGCYNYGYGSSAYFYNVSIDSYCNMFSIY